MVENANTAIGHCKHGEFVLTEGCPQCIAEKDSRIPEGGLSEGIVGAGGDVTVADIKEPEPTTAVINIAPGTDVSVQSLIAEAEKVLRYANERVISSVEDYKAATDDLSMIAKLKKAINAKRTEYVNPIKSRLDAVTSAFKTFTEPLDQADKITRQKANDFRKEQERLRLEAEAIEREKAELAKREAELKGESDIDLTPTDKPEVVAKRTITSNGNELGTMKVHKWELEDKSKVPLDYLMIDASKVAAAVKSSKGTISIPGIRIWTEETLRVR